MSADEDGLRRLATVNEDVFIPTKRNSKKRNMNPYYKKKISGLKRSLENKRPC